MTIKQFIKTRGGEGIVYATLLALSCINLQIKKGSVFF